MNRKHIIRQHNAGFNLLEISIVFAIIGLLVGGVLVGQDMIHSSELQKTVQQISDIDRNITTFRDQYAGYPGDIRNASSFWSGNINGNGDGIIGDNAVGGCAYSGGKRSNDLDCPDYFDERARFFTHLGLAGLGKQYADANLVGQPILGVHFPVVASNAGAGMMVGSNWESASGSNMRMEQYLSQSLYLYLGVCRPTSIPFGDDYNDCAVFTPIDAQNIDSKLDDGQPLSGTIFGQSYNTICATGTAANTTSVTASNSYNVRATALGCNLIVNMGD